MQTVLCRKKIKQLVKNYEYADKLLWSKLKKHSTEEIAELLRGNPNQTSRKLKEYLGEGIYVTHNALYTDYWCKGYLNANLNKHGLEITTYEVEPKVNLYMIYLNGIAMFYRKLNSTEFHAIRQFCKEFPLE